MSGKYLVWWRMTLIHFVLLFCPAEYPSDDIYHYASASYQFGRMTPPPPAPSLAEDSATLTLPHFNGNPASDVALQHEEQQFEHRHQQATGDNRNRAPACYDSDERLNNEMPQQNCDRLKSFSTVVYQAPSLNDVDEAGLVSFHTNLFYFYSIFR